MQPFVLFDNFKSSLTFLVTVEGTHIHSLSIIVDCPGIGKKYSPFVFVVVVVKAEVVTLVKVWDAVKLLDEVIIKSLVSNTRLYIELNIDQFEV